MCCKTSKNSREVVEKRKEEERKKKEKVRTVNKFIPQIRIREPVKNYLADFVR